MRVNDKKKYKIFSRYGFSTPCIDWFKQFLKLGENFENEILLENDEIPIFKRFLKDAGVITNDGFTSLGHLFKKKETDDTNIWALMFVNLSYTPLVGWYVENFNCGEFYSKNRIISELTSIVGGSKRAIRSIPNSIKKIAQLPFNKVGFGEIVSENKSEGFLIVRSPWLFPQPEVILYSLYRYAEETDKSYQFSFKSLIRPVDNIGISPVKIFGLESENFKRILNGLSFNYPDFISVSFTFDLDNVNLKEDKTSSDVLNLFLDRK